MDEHQELESYRPPSPVSGFLQIILGVVFLLLVMVGLIAGWHTFLQAAPILVQVLVILVAIAAPAAIIGKGAKSVFLDVQHMRAAHLRVRMEAERLQAMQDARWRENQRTEAEADRLRAEAERIRAEAEHMRIVVPFDDQGNAALRNPSTWQVIQLHGNMREYPALNSLTFHQSSSGMKVTEEKAPALDQRASQPSQAWLLGQLPENALTISPGVQAATGKLVRVSIVDVPHFKILGSTGFGKSCLAAALLDQATCLNRPQVFRLALLDLEHKTSRLFEDLPHIAQVSVGKRLVQLVATNADEVVEHLGYLKKELDRRASLTEQELCREPIVFMYVEELLSLQYEVVDPRQLKVMLADVTVLSVRGRKYGMFLLACMQTDYSTDEMKIAQKMFRFRAAAAIDQTAARAAGFINTELIKQNFQQGLPGQFVIEYPSFSEIVLAPIYDVKHLVAQKTSVSHGFTAISADETSPGLTLLKPSRNSSETTLKTDEAALQARFQEVRHFQSMGWGKVAIIEKVWKVKAGATQGYKSACLDYDHIMARLDQEEREASDAGSSVWNPQNSDQSS